ncbi:hypothetical protein SKAU_G00168310 [Synaphobranchus kaupii]|uniref:Uncharacterized protein n=1 Tax=Synaphobranchus kaupii TaxID=118154 RepID=A0A9Q1FK21_SYNKA|nr:hypothetical protein SKAU_G00168310 [Synaphobranchus kaupii]
METLKSLSALMGPQEAVMGRHDLQLWDIMETLKSVSEQVDQMGSQVLRLSTSLPLPQLPTSLPVPDPAVLPSPSASVQPATPPLLPTIPPSSSFRNSPRVPGLRNTARVPISISSPRNSPTVPSSPGP